MERNVPAKDDTIFRIYPMTKPVTSVAFMMLVEEGRVALDEPVHKHIPEWKTLGVFNGGMPLLGPIPSGTPAFLTKPPARLMQIVDLLRHTSGLTYGFQEQNQRRRRLSRRTKIGPIETGGTLQTMIDDLSQIPLEFSPRTRPELLRRDRRARHILSARSAAFRSTSFRSSGFSIRWE